MAFFDVSCQYTEVRRMGGPLKHGLLGQCRIIS